MSLKQGDSNAVMVKIYSNMEWSCLVGWTGHPRGQDGCVQVGVNCLGYSVVSHAMKAVRCEAATNSQKMTIHAVFLLVFGAKASKVAYLPVRAENNICCFVV